jgi:EmrB/QacA subfamily drug resistance transporter
MSKWWTLLSVCLATFMLLLDVTIVNVALPSIERDLHAGFSDLQWVVDAYALTLAAGLLTAGSVADLIGRRKVYVAGLALFTLASLFCGLADDPTVLNLSRGLQGIGAAAMFACALALLATAYQGRDRGTAFGIWGATTGAAVAVGPLVGGVLTQAIGWEAIFFVNIPLGLAVIALTLRTVRESRNERLGRIDVPGVVTFSAALFLLVFALIRGNDLGWGSGTIVGMLVGAAVLLVAFLVVERRSDHPMLELALFRKPAFVGASVAAFVLSASMFAMFLYLTLYIQNQLSYSALESGLRFLPTTLLSFIVAPAAGKLAERLGIRWFVGFGLVFVGAGLFLMSGLSASDDWTALLPGLALAGVGIGMVNPPLATAAVGVVEPWRAGMASGINSTFRQVGIATGVAAWGAVFQSTVNDRAAIFARAVGGKPPPGRSGDFSDFISFGVYHRLGARATAPGRDAFIHGLDRILVLAGTLALVGAVLCFVLIRPKDFVGHGETPAPAPGPGLGGTEPQPQPAPA